MQRIDHTSSILYSLLGSFCAGVVLQLVFALDVRVLLGLASVSVLSLLASRLDKQWIYVALACAAIALGMVRASMSEDAIRSHTIFGAADSRVEVVGRVSDDPEVSPTGVRASLALIATTSTALTGVVLAQFAPSTHIAYGDTLTVRGVVKTPEPFLTQTKRVFEYGKYEEAHGIDMLLSSASVVTRSEAPWSLQGFLYTIRHRCDAALVRALPQPHAALAQGILLGEQKNLPPEIVQHFIATGLVHVVALSGQNIAVVSEAVFRIFGFLPRMFAFSVSGVSILLFVLMVGSGASVVRASIMAGIALLTRYFHRSVLALRVLFLTILGMVMWNPLSLFYDPSFQLSILATIALITLAPFVETKLNFMSRLPGLRSMLATTIAVEIFTLPALLYMSGILSFAALPTNLLVLWVVPYAMLFSFIAALCALVHPALATIPGALAHASLEWLLLVPTATANLPYAFTTIAPFPAPVVLLIYVPLTALAVYTYRTASR